MPFFFYFNYLEGVVMITSIHQLKFNPMNEIHNNEVKVLNQLLEAIQENNNIPEKFKLFLNDVKYHFNFEEELMEKYNFFATIPHKMEHSRILEELKELNNRLDDRKFLREYFEISFIPWLDNHIKTMDTITAGYFDMIGLK